MRSDLSQSALTATAFEDWARDEKGWVPKTLQDYLCVVRHAAWWADNRQLRLEDLTTAQLRSYLFGTKPTPRTRNARRCALRAYYGWLVNAQYRPDNPADPLPRLPEKRLLPKPLPRELVPALLEAAAGKGPREAALICIYLFTGLRLSEVQHLTWEQVAHEWICLVKKGGDERTVYLAPVVREALRRWRSETPGSVWVFESEALPGQPYSKSWFERTVARLAASAGIPNGRPHRLRHTFATALLADTSNLLLVQKALGHASVQSTQIYAEVYQLDVAAALKNLHFGAN